MVSGRNGGNFTPRTKTARQVLDGLEQLHGMGWRGNPFSLFTHASINRAGDD